MRQILAFFLAVALWCGAIPHLPGDALAAALAQGEYPVQQATYNDGDGEYSLMLLNTNPGVPPVYRSTNLQLARLTDEAIASGQKSYLEIKGDTPVLYLTEDFKIEYIHNVTEVQTNPQTGRQETVIVQRESNFWSPFAGAVAGQAIGSLLFSPRYYVPPMYQPGGVMRGYGGYGSNYDQAVQSYQARYNTPPPAVKNRQALRTTGSIRTSPLSRGKSNLNKPTGSGFGSSNLRTSPNSGRSKLNRPSSFGSGRSSFGSGRRMPVRMRRR